jgi:hypothetical protein
MLVAVVLVVITDLGLQNIQVAKVVVVSVLDIIITMVKILVGRELMD